MRPRPNRGESYLTVAVILWLCGCVLPAVSATAAAGQPKRAADTMAERVRPCTSCHGKEGRATSQGYLPRIAGKPARYLYNQLVNFREGRRHYALMSYLVDHLSDAYLYEMAGYFAALDVPYPPPQTASASRAVITRGEALVRQGDPARNVPACVECHGDNLMGAVAGVPGLLGLSVDYLQAQLGQWRTGTRRAIAPDCMAKIATNLAPEDASAAAIWLATQPVPQDALPRKSARELPMECGGLAR